MSQKKDTPQEIQEFDQTVLVKIKPSEATLPIDTTTEWNKGYILLNTLIKMLYDDVHKEEYIDDDGMRHTKTVINPQLIALMKERRRVLDQIWKIAGGEAMNEAKKETAKKMIDFVWQSQEKEIKEKHKDDAIEIIEEDVYDED